jgi:hypothetical protein
VSSGWAGLGRVTALIAVVATAAAATETLGACHGAEPSTPQAMGCPAPTARLVIHSNLAGALEPCGCTEDQLGGVDHLGSLVAQLRDEAPMLFVSAGALLFDRQRLEEERATQDRLKARTIAAIMKELGLAAWTPGAADFAAGKAELAAYAARSGAALLGTNLQGMDLVRGTTVRTGQLAIGLIGVSDLQGVAPARPPGVTAELGPGLVDGARREVERLRAEGARIIVALASMRRGEALRFAEALGELSLLVVGEPSGQGTLNDEPVPPMMVGSTLVVQTANHGQGIAVVDLFVDGSTDADEPVRLHDNGDLARAERLDSLNRRIRKLEVRINNCDRGGDVSPTDLQARRAELASLRAERSKLQRAAKPRITPGSFRYEVHEVREDLGAETRISEQLTRFYRQVNEHNRTAFADRKPPPAAEGQATYVGAAACESCHGAAYTFWKTRPHAKAYATLQSQFKEYNLECVGCHVTGYERPGGSTVTHNALLRDVQCEECHGPGSLHLERPEDPELVVLNKPLRFCVDACHHPPHVEGFDPQSKLSIILGPGHGR